MNTLDLEVYPNYFLATFRTGDGQYYEFEIDDFENKPDDLKRLAEEPCYTFNGRNFDKPLFNFAMRCPDALKIYNMSQYIIENNTPGWMWDTGVVVNDKAFRLTSNYLSNQIDIQEVLPGMASLKLYGCRAGFPRLRELPVEPGTELNPQQMRDVRLYCRNDVDLTYHLATLLRPQLKLRRQLTEKYDYDMMSKSDPQCAEAILRGRMDVRKRVSEVVPFKYKVPDWVKFTDSQLKNLVQLIKELEFNVSDKGVVKLPIELLHPIEYAGKKYKFGIGGLHSQEKNQVVRCRKGYTFGEFDVASMYPSIICEQGLYPKHLGPEFLKIYNEIRVDRIDAKVTDKVKAEMYKIVLNGSYGKFGSKYSFLYSPELLIQTTITGQLALLMLIEMMTEAGGEVFSANTDGVNVMFKESVEPARQEWERLTSYQLEFTPYRSTHSRDVNNYIAFKNDGVKGKGAFAKPSLMKNPEHYIVTEAIINYLDTGQDIATTIYQCNDIQKFISCRTVRGGAVNSLGEPIGKVVRWYYSTVEEGVIRYATNGNTVPKTQGARALLDLPDGLPEDLDYAWYIRMAKKWTYDLEI